MAEKLEDLNLPNAVVARLIKEALPDGINVAKEARTALAKAASVFVLYVTSASTNVAKRNNRKTISGSDVLDAMEDIEFEQFVEPLKESLESYKKSQKVKKDATAKRKLETHKEDDKEVELEDDVETVELD